jgi:hypothetical protein
VVLAGMVVQGSVWLSPTGMLMCKSSPHQGHGTSLSGTIRWQRFSWSVLAAAAGQVRSVLVALGLQVVLVVPVDQPLLSQFRSHL